MDSGFLLRQSVVGFNIQSALKGELIAPVNSQELSQTVF